MTRTLALLLALTVAACGSASQAGPKTANPPLKKEPPTKAADPGEKPAVEQDGDTLKFNTLGFRMTMTQAPWQGKLAKEDGGTRIVFMRPDLEAVLVLIPIQAQGETAASIAENQRQLASQQTGLTASAVADEGHGRQALTVDRTEDGVTYRTYVGVLPHPTVADAYIVAVGHSKADASDAFLKEVRTVLDSVAPL